MTIIDDARDWQQAIADRTALTEQVAELTQVRDAYKQQIADLQNQIDTANLQHQNDQQTIGGLQTQVAEDVKERQATEVLVANLRSDNATNALMIDELEAANRSLQSVKVYDALEYLPWALNTKAEVGGSGLGTGGSKLPGVEMAELWVNPDAPIAPVTTNYMDGYFTQDKPLDDTLTRFKMETLFMLPTQADVDACQCLEMEARQVLTGGLMFVWAVQLYFGGNKFRYWDYQKKWQDSGVACPKFLPGKFYHVEVAGHRDASNVYHDYIAINGQKVDLTGKVYAAYNLGWKQMNRCALQIDSKESATPTQCRVKIGNCKFTVSQ